MILFVNLRFTKDQEHKAPDIFVPHRAHEKSVILFQKGCFPDLLQIELLQFCKYKHANNVLMDTYMPSAATHINP